MIKISELLELESVDMEYIEDQLVRGVLDYLDNYYYFNSDIVLNSYLYDKVYNIGRLENIKDYINNIEDIEDYNQLIINILDNILDKIDPIGYIDYMYIYDTIEYNNDTYFLIYQHGWRTVLIDYTTNRFIINDHIYNLDDTVRL